MTGNNIALAKLIQFHLMSENQKINLMKKLS